MSTMNLGSVFSKALPNISGLSTSSTPLSGGGAALSSLAPVTTPNTALTTPSTPSRSMMGGYTPSIQWEAATGTPSNSSSAQAHASAALRHKTVEEVVEQREQAILDKILKDTEEESRHQTNKYLEMQMNQMWEQDRNVWLQELVGFRSLSGSASTASAPELRSSTDTLALPPSSTAMNNNNAWSQTHALMLHRGNREGYLDPNFVVAHANVVRQLSHPLDIAEALKNLVGEAIQNQNPDPILSGYSTAWDWIFTMLRTGAASSPIERASSTLVHLCRQFEDVLMMRVQAGITSGAVTDTSTFSDRGARACQLYVNLNFGTSQSVWTVLYYCLRIGQAKAALEVWMSMADPHLSDPHRDAISRILRDMSQAETQCIWESGVPIYPSAERRALEQMIDRQDSLNDIHAKAALLLLTGHQDLPTDESTPGFCNLEDYLFGRLWISLLSANPINELRRFGSEIQANGSYFQDENSGGWSYALPLLVSQQYARAFSHLAESGRDVLLQAAHLTLVLATAGIEINNLGDASPDRPILASIVEAYGNAILAVPSAGPLVALEYLVRIPDKRSAIKAAAKLIVTTGNLSELVGVVNNDGLREGGSILDQHLNHEELTAVLVEAADLSLHNPNDAHKVGIAAMCYMLAGKYDSVVSLLNKMISPPDQPDENRTFWLDQTTSFQKTYIDRRSNVYVHLERDGKRGLLEATSTLVNLNRFFQFRKEGRHEEAWSIVKSIGMIPSSQEQVSSMSRSYRENINDSIRSCYPAVLLGAMDSLYFMHVRMKKDTQGGAAAVVLQRLKQLQAQASLIVTFAGLIDSTSEQMDVLSHKQALMI